VTGSGAFHEDPVLSFGPAPATLPASEALHPGRPAELKKYFPTQEVFLDHDSIPV
jgi:hypothetical protein